MLGSLSAASRATLTGRSFFPHLISAPFSTGLHEAFLFAICACLVAAGASLLRGGKFHYAEPPAAPADADGGQRARVAIGAASGAATLEHGARELARSTTAEEQHAR